MVINYFKNGVAKVEVFNGAVDLIDRFNKEPNMLEGATDIVFRSCEMFVNIVKDKETLLQIAKELIRTEGACAGVDTYWKPSKYFRSKADIANIIAKEFNITDTQEQEEIMCCMIQPCFYENVSEKEIIEDISEAIAANDPYEE